MRAFVQSDVHKPHQGILLSFSLFLSTEENLHCYQRSASLVTAIKAINFHLDKQCHDGLCEEVTEKASTQTTEGKMKQRKLYK